MKNTAEIIVLDDKKHLFEGPEPSNMINEEFQHMLEALQ